MAFAGVCIGLGIGFFLSPPQMPRIRALHFVLQKVQHMFQCLLTERVNCEQRSWEIALLMLLGS